MLVRAAYKLFTACLAGIGGIYLLPNIIQWAIATSASSGAIAPDIIAAVPLIWVVLVIGCMVATLFEVSTEIVDGLLALLKSATARLMPKGAKHV